ncbi:unnamed protein product [Enterobius vermicularis]|uniref:Bax inhibitor 1 n=1 Tax=Enterobius vermicularis TaxID=51028 RepID=A0A0N4VIK5_ENTVE|nr:unnamed protein product [Enterobius vermicularis]
MRREKDVRDHLKAVYGTLSVGLAAAAIGAALHILTDMFRSSFLLSLAPIGLMIALCTTPHSAENERKRFFYFLGFTCLTGISTGPLIEQAISVEPSIIMTAFLATAVVFGCFTMAALHAPSTKYLHLEGILMSSMTLLLITVLFSRSPLVDAICLWFSFGINCALILYDTQKICEKRRHGDTDYIWHTIDLFLDFVNLFRHILTILKDKEVFITGVLAPTNDTLLIKRAGVVLSIIKEFIYHVSVGVLPSNWFFAFAKSGASCLCGHKLWLIAMTHSIMLPLEYLFKKLRNGFFIFIPWLEERMFIQFQAEMAEDSIFRSRIA